MRYTRERYQQSTHTYAKITLVDGTDCKYVTRDIPNGLKILWGKQTWTRLSDMPWPWSPPTYVEWHGLHEYSYMAQDLRDALIRTNN